MATKLIRLVNDKKKSLNNSFNNNFQAGASKRMRDIDTEELINELQKKNTELELQNRRLKENVTFLHILCSLVSNCCQIKGTFDREFEFCKNSYSLSKVPLIS